MKLRTWRQMKELAGQQGWILLSNEQTKELQGHLLGMMKDVVAFCDRNDIQIFLCGGSALGALRHGGFIPWDDDVDVVIPRGDMAKFVELFPEELGDRYWLHSPQVTPERGMVITRIREKGTVLRAYEDINDDECGVFIDIFVMENVYENGLLRYLHGLLCTFFSAAVSCCRFFRDRKPLMKLIPKEMELWKILRLKIAIGALLSIIPLRVWTKTADSVLSLCHNNNSEHIAFPSGAKGYFGEILDRKSLIPARMLPFEDTQFPVFWDIDYYLNNLFGPDYMVPPPAERRERHPWLEVKLS